MNMHYTSRASAALDSIPPFHYGMRERYDMSEHKLHQTLRELKTQIGNMELDDTEARQKLETLVENLERQIDSPGDAERRQTLVESVRDSVEHFEVEHPTLTAILNDLMMTLSNMGI